MHYVIGDIHGCYKAFIRLKNRIERQDSDAKFILIGDIVDRGPEVIKIVRWANDNITSDGKYQMILGNHEENHLKNIDYILDVINKDRFEEELEYMMPIGDEFIEQIYREHVGYDELVSINNMFKSLPLYKELDIITNSGEKKHFIIVHGGLSESMLDRDNSIIESSIDNYYNSYEGFYPRLRKGRDILLWTRNAYGYPSLGDTIVINGHTPTIAMVEDGAEPGKIFYSPNNINVDCGMVYSYMNAKSSSLAKKGNLAAYCLETGGEEYAYKR